MGKSKNNQVQSNKSTQPKGDAEFAGENGLKKIALRAQKDQNK